MGVSLSTAKVITTTTFLYDFLVQQWAIGLSKPDMKVVNDRNPGCFSPMPYFIGGYFFPQQILQAFWLREFFRPASQVSSYQLDLAPFYALGNFCIGTWPFYRNHGQLTFHNRNTGNSEKLKTADWFVIVNTLQSLYWVYFRRAMNPTTYQEKLTNAVAISFAGVGILDFLHNTSIAYFPRQAPSLAVKAAAFIGFPLLAWFSPVAMGMALCYDAIGISIGQYQLANKTIGSYGGGGGYDWAKLMGLCAAVTAAVVGMRYKIDQRFV
ncbi:hypothetical protein QFC21_002847 [Naganishia friedmannii]|uniref:Uncharacterized protein n=1 Tax=Naganishia friedmannii TaxID=89922 RepID=A0ACC2VU70_9TREE|nr:hypothetical protein QFC21_002847 [Naganishia friedmannii]